MLRELPVVKLCKLAWKIPNWILVDSLPTTKDCLQAEVAHCLYKSCLFLIWWKHQEPWGKLWPQIQHQRVSQLTGCPWPGLPVPANQFLWIWTTKWFFLPHFLQLRIVKVRRWLFSNPAWGIDEVLYWDYTIKHGTYDLRITYFIQTDLGKCVKNI